MESPSNRKAERKPTSKNLVSRLRDYVESKNMSCILEKEDGAIVLQFKRGRSCLG